jgi:hypothetical protein
VVEINHLHALLAAIVLGIGLVSVGILADGVIGRQVRRAAAALGCCVILLSVIAF